MASYRDVLGAGRDQFAGHRHPAGIVGHHRQAVAGLAVGRIVRVLGLFGYEAFPWIVKNMDVGGETMGAGSRTMGEAALSGYEGPEAAAELLKARTMNHEPLIQPSRALAQSLIDMMGGTEILECFDSSKRGSTIL